MKKKYIIALEDRNVWSCGVPAKTLLLSDVSIFGTDLASVNTGIELTPYTEPDLEQVRKEAYEKGYKAGKEHCPGQLSCMDVVYQKGFRDGTKQCVNCEDFKENAKKEAYQRGLADAWEAARTLWNTPNRKEIFGHTTFNTVLTTLTAQETIEKIRQYEQGKEMDGLRQNIQTIVDKCGYSLDEIAEVLEKMKEDAT